jgi:hypothetical protein
VRNYHCRLTDLTAEQVAHTTDEQGVHHERNGERSEFRRDASVHVSLLVNWQRSLKNTQDQSKSRAKPEARAAGLYLLMISNCDRPAVAADSVRGQKQRTLLIR